jgi:hypothetical protein
MARWNFAIKFSKKMPCNKREKNKEFLEVPSHKNEIVQETAIRVFECWGGESSLKILENVSVSSKWVEEYLKGVISDLKSEYAY